VTDSHDYYNTEKSIEKSVGKDLERLGVLTRYVVVVVVVVVVDESLPLR